MSRIDELPADQKATLQLLLKQGKSYDELATLLRLDPDAVRERALNALDGLGPPSGTALAPARQDEVSDYLLGQQSASERAETRTFLEGSAAGRGWARAVSGELRPFAGDALADVPAEAAEVEEAFGALTARHEARERQEQSSRLGGGLLLLGVAAILVVLVVLVISRLGGDDNTASDTPTSSRANTTASTPPGTSTPADPNGGIESQIPMTSTSGDALASAFILKQPTGRVLGINGQNFPATDKTFNYAVWLYSSPTNAVRLGYVGGGVTASGKNKGRLVTGADPDQIQTTDPKAAKIIRAALTDVYSYKELLITKEAAGTDSDTPGKIVVSGPIVKPASAG